MNDKKAYIIGRQGDIVVSDQSVSRQHARLTKTNEGLIIEDLDSTGGTYVNGRRIKKKQISAGDDVVLGGYRLDINKILSGIPLTDNEFSDGFVALKGVYENYAQTKIKIQSSTTGQMMIKRSVPMALPGIVIAMLSFTEVGPMAAIIGSGLSTVAIVAGAMWGAKEQSKMPERMAELEEQFKIDYSCPACKKPYGQQNSWESLRRQGQCPYCRRPFGV